MGQQIVGVRTFDDMYPDLDATTKIRFGWHGQDWELDAAESTREEFAKILEPWLKVAHPVREVTPGRPAGIPLRSPRGRLISSQVRTWAREHGYPVGETGRMPDTVWDDYRQAHDVDW